MKLVATSHGIINRGLISSLPLHGHHRPRVLALHVLLEPGAVGVGVGAQAALVPLVPRVVPPVPVPLKAVLAGEGGVTYDVQTEDMGVVPYADINCNDAGLAWGGCVPP